MLNSFELLGLCSMKLDPVKDVITITHMLALYFVTLQKCQHPDSKAKICTQVTKTLAGDRTEKLFLKLLEHLSLQGFIGKASLSA